MSTQLLPPIAVLDAAPPSSPAPQTVAAPAPAKKSKGKENVALQQTSLPFANKTATAGSKKRSLILANGTNIDIDDKSLPATKEVVEAMRARILELEDALAGQPPAKKARTSKATEAEPTPGASTSAVPAVSKKPSAQEAKKTDALIKKMWTRLQKEVKAEGVKFRHTCKEKTVRFEEVIEESEFQQIFIKCNPRGRILQPRADNKPNSTVWIVEYGDEGVQDIFGKHYKELKGNLYSMGGFLAQFEKGKKMGTCALEINRLDVNYSTNTMKCALKFEVVNEEQTHCIMW